MTGPDIGQDLFDRAKARDRRALDVVLAALRPALVERARQYLARFTDDASSDAEDVAQSAMLAIWEHIEDVPTPGDLINFGLKAALNGAKNTRRSNHRRRERVVVDSDLVGSVLADRQYTADGVALGDGNYLTIPKDNHHEH